MIAAYGDSLSEAATVTYHVFVISPVQDVLAAKTALGYDISWTAPNAITAPDSYEIWFLKDGDQLDSSLWNLVASVDSVVTVSDNSSITGPGDYLWAVKALYGTDGMPVFSNVVTVDPVTPPLPTETKLLGNFPNPFNPETRIKLQLKQDGPVKLLIFNDKGQLIRTLRNQNMAAGEYLIPWDGKNDNGRTVNSGLYIYKLITTGYSKAGKMMLIK
ncbi:MAG TPA: FlgD immunoglobulin-like domain containing protein [Candidatus Cloacimonadota bacterium]|nr:FlgD immunoglobulin-like domain containing protein [Candidatus Cloacimonadota bacterium]